MNTEDDISPGDVVQLDPEHHTHHDGFWAGQLLIVTDVKSWGIQGYARVPEGEAHYRAEHGTYLRVGAANWLRAGEEEA